MDIKRRNKIMLYFLLTIIAIGVLLCSDIGRMILGGILILLAVGVLLVIGFWTVVAIIAVLSNKYLVNQIIAYALIILFFSFICYSIRYIYDGIKSGKFTFKKTKKLLKELLQKIKNSFAWGSWK